MSSTLSRYSLPSPVLTSVPSPYHRRLIPSAAKLRLTRSGARHRPLPGRVLALRFFFRRAARPSWRISPATVFSLTRQPSSRSAAVIRGDPSVPPRPPNSRAISAFSRSRRAARGESSSCFHL
jgi:hypothetical protein